MSRLQQQVIEFHEAMEIPIIDYPQVPAVPRVRLRARLVVEECLELVESLFEDERFAPEMLVARRVLARVINEARVAVNMADAADALADIDYVVEGTRIEFGIHGDPIADEVHRANMAKVGGPKRESDGKQLKPEGWRPPDVKGRLHEQVLKPASYGLRCVLMLRGESRAPR